MTKRTSDAIEALYREAVPKLWRSLLLFTGDPEIASEAVAETFARALAAGDAIRTPERWIWRVGFRVATTELRRRAREVGSRVELPYEMPAETVELVEGLRRLTPNQRTAVVLHYYGDASVDEIARRMGWTRSAAGVHLYRARNKLRSLLADDDG